MVKTNCSTLPTVYNIQQSAMQGSNDTIHTMSRRTAATTRFNTEGIGSQKQTAPRFYQHLIRWAFTSQAFTRWHHLSTHLIKTGLLFIYRPWKDEMYAPSSLLRGLRHVQYYRRNQGVCWVHVHLPR